MRGITVTKHGKYLFVRNTKDDAELVMLVRLSLSPHDFFFSLAVHFCKVDFLLGLVKE